MRKTQRVLATLCLVFIILSAMTFNVYGAEASMNNFYESESYKLGQFPDISESEWFGYNKQSVVCKAYELGLMQGKGAKFDPNVGVTLAEAITMAARVNNIYSGGDWVFSESSPWYYTYLEYTVNKEIVQFDSFEDYTKPATRAEMAYIFARALPEEEFTPVNTIEALPDVNAYANKGVTNSNYDYQTNEFSLKIEYSVFHQMQGLIFNRKAFEQYASAQINEYDKQMSTILDKIITPGMTDRQKVKAVHDYMVVNYKYDVDFESGLYGKDTYAFHGLLKNGTGVCQAYAELFFLFMCYEDIECYYVGGWADSGTGEYGLHAWNVVYADDGYYHVDVTFDDPVPDSGSKISYDYFLKTDAQMAKDHDW